MDDTPVKKLEFATADKENVPISEQPAAVEPELKKPITEVTKASPEPPKVAPGIKASEVDEPLLQENPQRFVLFPIKYHEVRAQSTRRVDA